MGSRHESTLFEVRHQQITIRRHGSEQFGLFGGGIGCEGSERGAFGGDLEGGRGVALHDGSDIIDGESTTLLGRYDEIVLIGGEGDLGNAHLNGNLQLRFKCDDVGSTRILAGERRSDGLGAGYDERIWSGSSHETLVGRQTQQR